MNELKITIEGQKAAISTPYSAEFVAAIKKIGSRRWDSERRVWTVAVEDVPAVREKMVEIWGHDDRDNGQPVEIEIEFREPYSELRAPVEVYGHILAKAWGRDSGARVGEGVTLSRGDITSSGSVKNWNTQILTGATFRLRVPKSLVDADPEPFGDTATVRVTSSADAQREALEAEAAKLRARLAEIERTLASL